MRLTCRKLPLQLVHPWRIARTLAATAPDVCQTTVVVVELQDADGVLGRGEAAPSARYGESPDSVMEFLTTVDPQSLAFNDLEASRAYLARLGPGQAAARCALDIALCDGAAQGTGQALCDHLGLGFEEHRHVTSFSLGIDQPDVIREKTVAAADFPILKLKLGSGHDRENLAALRAVAPTKPIRVDANEAWRSPEEALRQIEWLAADPHVEFVEQPLPATVAGPALAWLKARSPLPLFADESCLDATQVEQCAEGFHGINVKLVKTAGVTGARTALTAARAAGLQTMIGCMVESSILISAAAHLAALADHLDLDGSLLVRDDPFLGVTAHRGVLSFANTPARTGLQVVPRPKTLAAG